jgi:hypothetical protein
MSQIHLPCVNRTNGKPSYLALLIIDDTEFIDGTSDVTSVLDENNKSWDWDDVEVVTPKLLRVRLKGKKPPKKGDKTAGSDPDTGTLTVTVTTPPITDPIPVAYVDD